MRTPDELLRPVFAANYVRGRHNAFVTIVEFGDFECLNCKQAAPFVLLFSTRVHGRVTLAFRHFPVEEVQANALTAVEASEGAGGAREFCVCELDGYFCSDNEEGPGE
jgi:hypothetical protein